jgi:hypothetical protein
MSGETFSVKILSEGSMRFCALEISMKRFFGYVALAVFGLAMAGCATQGGGQVDPITSQFVPKSLYDFGPTLLIDANNLCNVGAAVEYNYNQEVCANPGQIIAQIPGQPFVTPAQMTMIVTGVCGGSGYGPSMPATATPGPEATCQAAGMTPAVISASMTMGKAH